MSDQSNLKQFVEMIGIVTAGMEQFATGNGDMPFTWDGDIRLRTHALNAKRMPTKFGMSIGKDNRESQRKIDLAVCLVGALMVRRKYTLTRKKKKGGRVV